jgi:hypothetical protein
MADESKGTGRSRSSGFGPRDAPDLAALESDPAMAPVTANTPLPPLNPLPLASQAGAGGSAQPPSTSRSTSTELPGLPPLPPANYPASDAPQQRAGTGYDLGITPGWAARTTFALIYTSIFLLTALAIAYAAIGKNGGLLIWVVIIIILLDIVYPLVVFTIARPGPAQPFRLPFLAPRRGP